MLYAVFFLGLGAWLLVVALSGHAGGLLLAWPAASLLLVGAAYAGLGPRVLGKRPDGRLAWWAVLLLGPFLLLTWLVWHGQRLLSREDCGHEVAPGLWLGRRAFGRELPRGVSLVVDVTAEFPAPVFPAGVSYLCVPILDGSAPPERVLRDLVAKADAWPGPVYIHCAQGHGRSALVMAAVLLARGLAPDAPGAEALLRRARPAVGLKRAQRRLLERLAGARVSR